MLRYGENIIQGVPVEVVRKRIRRINIRVARDGRVSVSVPKWWATLADAEAFLASKWSWVVKAREEMLARPRIVREPPTREEVADLSLLLDELNREWAARTGEGPFRWKLRLMKTLWGSCHWRKRVVTYNSDLARKGRDLVEYVVVHELTHFRVRNHGPEFQSLMDERLPGWRERRRRLNKGLA